MPKPYAPISENHASPSSNITECTKATQLNVFCDSKSEMHHVDSMTLSSQYN